MATAQVSAVGYGAYLGGQPVVGFLADHLGLVTSFVVVAGLCSTALGVASTSLSAHRTARRPGHRRVATPK